MSRIRTIGRVLLIGTRLYPGLFGGSRALKVVVYDGYGIPSRFQITGRVMVEQGEREPNANRSRTDNLEDNVKALQSRERGSLAVRLTVENQCFSAVTDEEGNFDFQGLIPEEGSPMPVGVLPVSVEVVAGAGGAPLTGPSAVGSGYLHILRDEPQCILVSDVDDTVVKTYVTRKRRMLAEALLKNAAQLAPVEGASQAYQEACSAGASLCVYVSGSPQNFYVKIRSFLKLHGFPAGPILLKEFGTDPLFHQATYKTQRIKEILQALPRARVVLVGDSGEHDPEIYRSLWHQYPDRIAGIAIRRLSDDGREEERFEGIHVIQDGFKDLDLLARLVRSAFRAG